MSWFLKCIQIWNRKNAHHIKFCLQLHGFWMHFICCMNAAKIDTSRIGRCKQFRKQHFFSLPLQIASHQIQQCGDVWLFCSVESDWIPDRGAVTLKCSIEMSAVMMTVVADNVMHTIRCRRKAIHAFVLCSILVKMDLV